MADTLPVRRCDGCGQTDDHPRVHYATAGDPDRLFHYDCCPAYVREQSSEIDPGVRAAAAGKRGQDVRDAMTTVEG